MKRILVAVILLMCCAVSQAQQAASTNNSSPVPALVNFSGILTDVNGKPLTGVVGVTFYLYQEQQGGSPLWIETQNVQPNASGQYSVMLGSTTSSGLPSNLFVAGEARWLGVQAQGQAEQPRVMLLSVPYAMKAGDAQTVGGLPASAFMLAPANGSASSSSSANGSSTSSGSPSEPNTSSDVTTTGGTVGTIPAFSTSTNIQSSLLSQTGITAINVKGTLNLPATGVATAAGGKNSQPQNLAASAFSSTTGAAVAQTFQWQTEPAGNDTSNPSGTLNLLFGEGTNKPIETGLNIASNGQITFASGQTFPGTGNGTITGVTAGSGLSGGGTSGAVTLANTGVLSLTPGSGIASSGGQTPIISNSGVLALTAGTGLSSTGGQSPTVSINTSVVPELNTTNAFTQNLSTTGELAAGGAPGHNIANGAVEVDAGNANNGSYLPGLTFGGGGETISSNRAGTTNQYGIDFYTKVTRRMSLTNSGNFGIGTATPTHLLEVDGVGVQMAMVSTGNDSAISVKNTGTGGREYWIDSGSGTSGVGSGNFAVWDATAGAPRLVIDPTGNVGIGTLTPAGPLEVDSSSAVDIYAVGASTTGIAVNGVATATSGEAWGVAGSTESDAANAYGVYGDAFNFDSLSSAVGVYGQSLGGEGVGVFGQYGATESGTGKHDSGIFPVGVWGDAGPGTGNDNLVAVMGTADDAAAGHFENDSPTGYDTLTAAANNAASDLFYAVNNATEKDCQIDNNANLSCSGTIGASVSLDAGARQVAMLAIQSPKNWFEDFGSGQLVNGVAVIALDSDFIQTVNTETDYKVFPVPNGDCKGLYVTHKTANSFEVRELGGGTSSVAFDYRISALRKNYENVRFADRTADMQKQRQMLERMHARKGSGQSHSPRRSPLLNTPGQRAELRPAEVR